MIKVFAPTDRDFTTNGDAVIKATRAVVHKVDNGDYYLALEAPIDYVDYLKDNKIIVVDTPQGAQAFRAQAPIEVTRTKVKLKALHVYYDANNYLIADSYVVDKNCNDALEHLNAATDNTSPFNVSSNVTTIDSYRCVRTSLTEAISTVLSRWGGHLVRDNFDIQILDSIGADNGVTIQYKKNLKNITVSTDWSGVCTKLLPVGKDGILLPDLYVTAQTQYSIPFTKCVTFTQNIDQKDYPSEEAYIAALRADLLAQAQDYIRAAQYPARTYEVKAHVEKITDVGDVVEVIDDRLGVNLTAQVVSFEYDAILGQYSQINLGTIMPSLSKLMSNVTKEINTTVGRATQVIYTYIDNEIIPLTRLTGGELDLGGDANILGYISVKDSEGSVIGSIDQGGFKSLGRDLGDYIYIGSQTLLDSYTMNDAGTDDVISAPLYNLIRGIFAGVDIPAGYERGYKLTAQANTTGASNYASVRVNSTDLVTNRIAAYSTDGTLRGIITSHFYKESDIALTPIGNNKNGLKLRFRSSTGGGARFYNVTIHGYLIKSTTTPSTTTPADINLN